MVLKQELVGEEQGFVPGALLGALISGRIARAFGSIATTLWLTICVGRFGLFWGQSPPP